MFKIYAATAALSVSLCLGGCAISNGVLTWSDSAQTKIEKVVQFEASDIALAEKLAAADALNDPAMRQCLPAFQTWMTKLHAQAASIDGVSGAASTLVVKRWAQNTIKAGVPSDVQLACGAVADAEGLDVADMIDLVRGVAK